MSSPVTYGVALQDAGGWTLFRHDSAVSRRDRTTHPGSQPVQAGHLRDGAVRRISGRGIWAPLRWAAVEAGKSGPRQQVSIKP